MNRITLALSVVLLPGCFIDALGGKVDEGAGGSGQTTSSVAGPTSASSSGAGGDGGAGGNVSGVGGGGGSVPCANHGALLDGQDDQLTFLPDTNIMSDSTDFKFQIRVEPAAMQPNGASFLAGRYDPLASQGWGLFLDKGAGLVGVRVELYRQGPAVPCVAVSTPIATFPALLQITYVPPTLSIAVDGNPVGSVTCTPSALSGALSEPFVVGGARAPFVTFRGKVDDISYISDAAQSAACVTANVRDRAWDFEQLNGQLVLPVAGCVDDLVLGISANETATDPAIACMP